MAHGRYFDEWDMTDTNWKLAVAKYLRWTWKQSLQHYNGDGPMDGYLKSVEDRAKVVEDKLKEKFTSEEWDLIYSDDYVEVLDKW